MKNFVLGVLFALSVSSFAVSESSDGSVTFTRDEIETIKVNFYQLQYNFRLAVDRVNELSKELETLKKAKCT